MYTYGDKAYRDHRRNDKLKKLLCVLLFFFVFSPHVSANNENTLYSEFDFSGIYDALSEDTENKLGSIEDFNTDAITPKGLLSYVLSAVKTCLSPFLKELALLFTFICAIAFVRRLTDSFDILQTQKAVSYAIILSLSLIVYKQINSDLLDVNKFLTNIQAYYASAVPIMTGMYALGGNTAVAAANGASSTVVLSIVSFLSKDLVLPASRLNFALALASSETIKLDSVVKTVTGFCSKLLTVTMSLVASGMLLSCKLASSADSIGVRVLKFAASSFVPIVGGALGEATSTLTESVRVIRSGFGIFGIAAIFYIIVPVIVRIWSSKLAFSLASGLAEILNLKKEGAFLKDCSAIYILSLSALIAISMCFVFALAIFVNTAAVK